LECNSFIAQQETKKAFKKQLHHLKEEIIKHPQINIIQLLTQSAIKSLPHNTQNLEDILTIELDKNWSFDDIKITILNTQKI